MEHILEKKEEKEKKKEEEPVPRALQSPHVNITCYDASGWLQPNTGWVTTSTKRKETPVRERKRMDFRPKRTPHVLDVYFTGYVSTSRLHLNPEG